MEFARKAQRAHDHAGLFCVHPFMKPPAPILPVLNLVKQSLLYFPESGEFHWRVTTGRSVAGTIAGSIYGTGHRIIKVNQCRYLAHRLAWAIVHEEEPPPLIDHRNGDPSDNRIANLREATRAQNAMNSKLYRNSKSGIKGVSWDKVSRKWAVSIYANGKGINLGRFDHKSTAAAAYRTAAEGMHGEFARP